MYAGAKHIDYGASSMLLKLGNCEMCAAFGGSSLSRPPAGSDAQGCCRSSSPDSRSMHMVQQKQQEKHHQRTIQTKASLAKRVTTLFQTRRWADSVKSDGREILYSLGAVLLQCCVVVVSG